MKFPQLTGRQAYSGARLLILCAALLTPSLLCLRPASSQSDESPKDYQGETKKVVVVPDTTTDAGEILFKPDTDNDGMPDPDELANGTDPHDPGDADQDLDGDGLSNGEEVASGSRANLPDTDGDGVPDGEEVRLGFNPNDPTSRPPTATLVRLEVTPANVLVSINTLLGQSPVRLMVNGVRDNGTTIDLTQAPGTTYQSLDEAVVVIDGSGTLAGVAPGTTTVTVTNGALTAQVPVTVTSFTPGGLSSVVIPGTAYGVAVSGDYAYVAAGTAGLQVVGLGDRQSPTVIGSLDTPGTAQDVRVVGAVAYLADGSGGLRLIDVSNPAAPAPLGVAATQGDAQDVAIDGGRAYVAVGGAGLKVVDVSNPSAPSVVGGLATETPALGVDVSGGLALVVTGPGGSAGNQFVVVDVSNPAAPRQLGGVSTEGAGADLVARDRFAYVAISGGGMRVVDFTTPSRPVVTSQDFFINRADVAAFGRYAFFSADPLTFGVPLYDLADPSAPQYMGTLDFAPQGTYKGAGISMDDQYVYQATNLEDFGGGGPPASFGPPEPTARLFVGRYRVPTAEAADTAGIAPTVTLLEPVEGQQVIEGSQLRIAVSATDDVRVADVKFSVNGVPVAADLVAPYEFTLRLPLGTSPLEIVATATDSAGNSSSTAATTVNVDADPPPTVDILVPEPGTQLTAGLFQDIYADYGDNGFVTSVEYFVNGVKLDRQGFDVPLGVSEVTIEVVATDNVGKQGRAQRTYGVVPYTGPTTTVTGRVLDTPGVPASGLSVTVFNVFRTQTGPDGGFTLEGVPTVRGQIEARLVGPFNGRQFVDFPMSKASVEGGVTDYGDIQLTSHHALNLFETPTAVAYGGVLFGGGSSNFLFGFENYNQLYWPAGTVPDPNRYMDGALVRWTNTPILPSGGVMSADILFGHLYAQMKGQPGTLTDFHFAFNPVTLREEPHTETLETGLGVECDALASGSDRSEPSSRVLVCLGTAEVGTPQEGSVLSARVSSNDEPFAAPVLLPAEPGVRLRAPKLSDVNRDGLSDLLLLRQVAADEWRLVVYPRVSAGAEFGPPVESPVTVRSTTADGMASNYAVAVLDASGAVTVAALGEDRVRLYKGDMGFAFTPSGEIALPEGTLPLGLTATEYHRNDDPFVDRAGGLVVVTAAAAAPGLRAVRAYVNRGGSFEPARVFGYRIPEESAGAGARVFITYLDSFSFVPDVVAVEGQTSTALYNLFSLDLTPPSGGGGPVD